MQRLSRRQRKATRKLIRNRGGAIFWKVGRGKTRIALSWFASLSRTIKDEWVANYIVVCRRASFGDWRKEMKKIGLSDWRVAEAEGEDDFALGAKASNKSGFSPSVWLVSHGMLGKMRDAIVSMNAMFTAIVYDEGYLYKNPHSEHCKAANKISVVIGRAAILSGSIMTARSLEDPFGQMFAINKHLTLARTLTDFRSRFMFHLKIGEYQYGPHVNARGSKMLVARELKPLCSFNMKPQLTDRLVVNDVKVIEPTKDQAAAFKSLRSEFWLSLKGKGGDEILLRNMPSVIIKCQQISDGWLNLGRTTGEVVNPLIDYPSAKESYLLEKVQEILAQGDRVIVWCAFRNSVDRLLHLMQKAKIKVYPFMSGIKFQEKEWLRSGQVVVGTEASGSSVNAFGQVPYAIYYSQDVKWLSLQQSKGRTNREDSAHRTCYYYFLHTKGSLDSLVYRIAHTSGRREAELIRLAGFKKWATS